MEELVEPHVVAEVGIIIQLVVTPVSGPATFHVAPKDMNDSVLDLLRNRDEIHVHAASRRALDLKVVTVVLVEPLQALDEQEIGSKPLVIFSTGLK
jgi:hypothetical protein